jgi:D-3-phosphoglycerate dehydrogenase
MTEQKRVIVLEELAPEGIELLRGDGLEVETGAGWDESELLRRIPGCHGLIVGPAHAVTAAILSAGGDLQVVGRTGLSVAGIDLAEATRRGVVVANTPQSNAVSAAEQALAMVLACARDLAGTHADLRAGRWEPEAWSRSGVEVRGRTLGIVGTGDVAPLLAEGALALGMKVLTAADDPGRVFADADFILVDQPGGHQTQGLVGEAELAQMKHGVRLISLAPAGVVDAAAPD